MSSPFQPPTAAGPDETVVFATPKIYGRHYKPSDLEVSARKGNEPDIAGWMRNRFPHPYTLDSARTWLAICAAQDPKTDFALCDSQTGEFLGSCGVVPGQDVECRKAEIGYWLGKEHWGGGYGTEACRALVGYVFERYPDILRIEAGVYSGNVGSEKVLGRAGFTKESVRRQAIFKNGKVLDLSVFALLREEYEEQKLKQ